MRIGGRSVSGYILSAPGRILSNPFVPSLSACLVSEGIPIAASLARIIISLIAVVESSSLPQTITTESLSVALDIFLTAVQSAEGILSPLLSERIIFGIEVRQAITRTRSEISLEK